MNAYPDPKHVRNLFYKNNPGCFPVPERLMGVEALWLRGEEEDRLPCSGLKGFGYLSSRFSGLRANPAPQSDMSSKNHASPLSQGKLSTSLLGPG